MRSITRTRIAIAVLAIVAGMIVIGIQQSHAATGGSTAPISTDQTITSTATGVTTDASFPDGNKTAQCFIQATSKSGVQANTFGACAGYALNVTCASGNFTGTPPDKGASVTINGTASWMGVYDNGATCTTQPKVGGAAPTLTADVTGLAAGQHVIAFWNTDAGNGFNSPNGRNGCVQYNDSAGSSTEACIQLSYMNGPGGTFYEVTAGAASGTFEQDLGSQITNNGNMTLGGVFIEAVGQAAGTPPTAPPTNTPLPPTPTATALSAANIPSGVDQFTTDPVLTTSATGVTSSQAFPDGGTSATCFVKINSKSGAQSETSGNCGAYTVTVTCSSFQFSSTPATDQHGAAVVKAGVHELSGAYDTGPSCTTVPNATLSYDVSGITAGTRVVAYWNNDAGTSARNGCTNYKDSTGSATRACIVNNPAGANGAFYEVVAGGTTGTFFQTQAAAGQIGASGNLTAGGVFIGATGGTTLSATMITVHRSSGINHLRWYSAAAVRGFNVLNGKTRLNRHLVTSTSGWYHFNTRHAVNHLKLVPVR